MQIKEIQKLIAGAVGMVALIASTVISYYSDVIPVNVLVGIQCGLAILTAVGIYQAPGPANPGIRPPAAKPGGKKRVSGRTTRALKVTEAANDPLDHP